MGMAAKKTCGNEYVMLTDEPHSSGQCVTCNRPLKEPFIRCAVCEDTCLCKGCFAKGQEVGEHQSNHAYFVVSDNFPLLAEQWPASEERRLLDLLLECGYGNWDDIGRRLGRPPAECKRHYDTTYLRDPPPEFPELQDCLLWPPRFLPAPLPPHLLRLGCENPPRLYSGLAGYNSLRSEFDVEHDGGHAEQDLALVGSDGWEEEDEQLGQALQAAMVGVYNDRLRERARRRRVLREHGLLLSRKNYAAMARYSATLGRAVVESLAPFAQLLSGPQFDFLLEGLHLAQELAARQARLSELRGCGLKTVQGAVLMQKLARARAESRRELRAGFLALPSPSLGRGEAGRGGSRRPAPPLEVVGLPLCERLSPEERELCAQARLVPENFLEFRSLLVAECKRHNGLRLAQARRFIKIDVNKTRKLFDFLMQQGEIFPPPD